MATISSPGIGSGLDINGLVSKLMAVEQQPLIVLQTKEASYQAKLTAFGTLKGVFSALQSAAQALGGSSAFSSMSASSSDTTVLSASAGTTAVAGSYNIGVEQLAKNQVLSTLGNYLSADTFNGGTLAITVGTTTTNVAITDGSSLATLAQAINDAKAGVTATVVNAGPPNNYQRLVLTSGTTGSDGTIGIAVSQTGSSGTQNLTDLAYSGTDTAAIKQAQAADNAVLSINNVSITRSSNTITDAITGVTLNLTKAGSIGLPVTTKLTVARNNQATQNAIGTFVSAYNAAVAQLHSLSAYNASTKTASVLTGDSIVRSLESQLPSLVQTTVTGLSGGISRLSDLGITLQVDGTLAVNSTKLQAALSDTNKDVAGLFSSSATGNSGVAVSFNNALTAILGSSGTFASRTDGINSTIKGLNKQQDDWQVRLKAIQARYQAQFNALDSLVAGMNSTSTYLTQQLSMLNSLATYSTSKSS
jgi:flagellar hook-associated protein 2